MVPQGAGTDPGRWMLRSIPRDAAEVLFCFPYSGVGGSSYWQWPRVVSGMHVVPLQPPGRENRRRENRPRTHREFAESLLPAFASLGGLPFAFFGHCGAVAYMLETLFALEAAAEPSASWMIASSWGAPQNGLYGRLNFVDLETHDFGAEVADTAGKMGVTLAPELANAAAELLRFDLVIQRGYEYPRGREIPVPVCAVGWSDDDVVEPAVAVAGWEEVARVHNSVLEGGHNRYLECPADLQDLIAELRHLWPRSDCEDRLPRRQFDR